MRPKEHIVVLQQLEEVWILWKMLESFEDLKVLTSFMAGPCNPLQLLVD
jgi:hypothetical protein